MLRICCRECDRPTQSGFALCTECHNSHPNCQGCGQRKVSRKPGDKGDTPAYYPYCSICRCYTRYCEEKAVKDGYCEACQEIKLCPKCNVEPLTGSFVLCKTCYDNLNQCPCGRKLLSGGDHCYKCTCRTTGCNQLRVSVRGLCASCEDKCRCITCGHHKSEYNENPECFKCQKKHTQAPCPSERNCGGTIGLRQDGSPYTYCVKCACANRACDNVRQDPHEYCIGCFQDMGQRKCAQLTCTKMVPLKHTYCSECSYQYHKHQRVLCAQCPRYKSVLHPYPLCRECETKRRASHQASRVEPKYIQKTLVLRSKPTSIAMVPDG